MTHPAAGKDSFGIVREHEVKLEVDDGFDVPGLDGVVAGAAVSSTSDHHVEDTYYDTEDLRLLRWGCTLRHRKRKGWTVKLPVSRTEHVLSRDEINFQGRAGKPPDEALTVVTPYARGRSLQVIARLDTRRTAHAITSAAGELLVEVVDDRTSCQARDGTNSNFRQVEAELGPGADPAVLEQVADRLIAAGARHDTDGIKVVKALGLPSLDAPDVVAVALGKDPAAGAVLRQALARSAGQMVTELPVALVGDAHGVHQARVATRRLRSDLRTFEPLLDPGSARQLHDDLKPLADHLGAIRDTDVLLARFDETLADHPEIDREAAERALDVLASQREAGRKALADYVNTDTFHRILDSVVANANEPALVSTADAPAADLLPALVRKRWQKLDKTASRLADHPDAAALHEVRLRAKRTRYAAEAVSGAFGKRARRFAKSLAEVQDLLGVRNDCVVAEEWLTTNAEQLDPAAAFAAGRLAQVMHMTSRLDRQDWVAPYQRAARKRNRSWFA